MDESSADILCKICKSKVFSGIKCSECESLYHRSCARLSTNVKIIDDNTIRCCDQSEVMHQDFNDQTFYEALDETCGVDNNKIDIRIVKYLLKLKDEVIHQLQERVKILVQHLETVTDQYEIEHKQDGQIDSINNNKLRVNQEENNKTYMIDDRRGVKKGKQRTEHNFINTESSDVIISDTSALNNEQTTDSVNIAEESGNVPGNSNNELWTEIVRKNSKLLTNLNQIDSKQPKLRRAVSQPRKKQILNGTNINSRLKAIDKQIKYKAVFISRLHAETTKKDLSDHIASHELRAENVIKLKTKFNSYSSFYVSMQEQYFQDYFIDNKWPDGCIISEFYGKLKEHQIVKSGQESED